VTWHCRACGQVGRVLQVANLQPDPVLEPEPPRPPDPEPVPAAIQKWGESPAVSLLESLRDVWTGETSKDREATAAGVPPDLLESIDSAADQVARETRAPRKGDR